MNEHEVRAWCKVIYTSARALAGCVGLLNEADGELYAKAQDNILAGVSQMEDLAERVSAQRSTDNE